MNDSHLDDLPDEMRATILSWRTEPKPRARFTSRHLLMLMGLLLTGLVGTTFYLDDNLSARIDLRCRSDATCQR